MQRIACITLVAALLVVSGCGLFDTKQPPFTAAEIDRLMSHSSTVLNALQKAEESYTGMNIREKTDLGLKAKNAKIQELGWDLHRYYYIKKNCNKAIRLHYLKKNIKRYKREVMFADSPSKRQHYTDLLEHREKELALLTENIDTTLTVVERVLLSERLNKLIRINEREESSFKWIES